MMRYKAVPKEAGYHKFAVEINNLFEDYCKAVANKEEVEEIFDSIYNRYTFYDLTKKKAVPKNYNRDMFRDLNVEYEYEELSKQKAIAKIRSAFSSQFSRLKGKPRSGKPIKILLSYKAIPKAAGDYEFKEQINLSYAEFMKVGADKVGIVHGIFGRYTFMDMESNEEIPMTKAKKKIRNAFYRKRRIDEEEEDCEEEYEDDSEEDDENEEGDDDVNEEGDDDEEGEVLKQAATAPKRSKRNAVHVPIKQEDTAVEVIEIDDDSDIGTAGLAASSSRVSNVENQDLAEAKAAVDVAVAKLKFEEAKIAEQNILNRRNT
jgi:hypothetical protein